MKSFFLIIGSLIFSIGLQAQDISLPAPQKEGGMPLMEALSKRQSARSYSEKPLSNQMLSNLLWAAWGINRSEDGRRTAPSSHNEQNTVLYCAMAEGLYTYDAQNHSLVLVTKKDIRAETGTQDYVKSASLNLMYVAKGDSAANWGEAWINAACVNAAFIAQNVYLFCASEGLSCVVRGSFDGEKLQEIMQLGTDKVSVLAQSVGFPAEKDK
ncbi:MAG: SagB/ThcOx family dehydrogenase [Bacteroidales bacterium]|nr:SagB/ThcOx family dehydrogenase [Bacteroidales bacterium]